jgi:glycerol-3-phosphate acyltransferase PlsY
MLLGIIFIIIAYLVGSLSSAVIVSKAMGLPDPRSEGSGNPGATNMLRLHGKLPAALTLLGDILKGFIPVLLAFLVGVGGTLLSFVALAAVIGHMFPVFFQFKGGKGIATALGGILVLSFWIAFVCAAIWLIIVATTRYISLASLIAAVLAVILMLFAHTYYFLPLAIMALLIIWRHMENIDRLRAGTESKINWKEYK